MISDTQRAQLLQLVQSPQWKAVEELKNELCAIIQNDSKMQESDQATLKKVYLDEGMVMGMNKLINEIYNECRHTKP